MALTDLQARVKKLTEPPARGPADQANRDAIRDWFPRGSELGFVHPETHTGLLLRESGDLDLFIVPHTGLRLHKDTQTATLFAQAIQLRAEQLRAMLDATAAIEALEAFKLKTRNVQVLADSEIRWKTKTFQGEADRVEVRSKQARLDAEGAAEVRARQVRAEAQTIEAQGTSVSIKAQTECAVEAPMTQVKGAMNVSGAMNIGGAVTFGVPVTDVKIGGEPLDPKVLQTMEMWQDLVKLSAYLQALHAWLQSHFHGDPASGVTTPPTTPVPVPPQLGAY